MPTTDSGHDLSEFVSELCGVVEFDTMHQPAELEAMARFCAVGGVALSCALRPPGASAPEEATNVMLKLQGSGAAVCVVPDVQGVGNRRFRGALAECMQRWPSEEEEEEEEDSEGGDSDA